MKKTLLQRMADKMFGHKYYVNIINTRGTDKCEATSIIHPSKAQANEHISRIASTSSFEYIETVSFRSRMEY